MCVVVMFDSVVPAQVILLGFLKSGMRVAAVRCRCLEFQHRAVTPAGLESARFYK